MLGLSEKNLTLGNVATRAGKGLDTKQGELDARTETQPVRRTLSGANVSIRAVNPNGWRGELMLAGSTIDTPGTLTLEADWLVMAAQVIRLKIFR